MLQKEQEDQLLFETPGCPSRETRQRQRQRQRSFPSLLSLLPHRQPIRPLQSLGISHVLIIYIQRRDYLLSTTPPFLATSFTSCTITTLSLTRCHDIQLTPNMTTPKSRPVFDEDDDTDSVKTDSTVESDLEAEYSVEKVNLTLPAYL
jgi:hypothetical protein